MSELKEKGAPRQTELLSELSNHSSQNEVIIGLLTQLCGLKANQGRHEEEQAMLNEEWRDKWLQAKKSSVRSKARGVALTFIQIGAGLVAIYIGALQVNQDNSLVKAVIAFSEALGGIFL